MHLRQRPAAGKASRPRVIGLLQPSVHEHRNVVGGLARFHHLLQIQRVVPRHEDLVRRPVQALPVCHMVQRAHRRAGGLDRNHHVRRLARPEDLLPCAGLLGSVGRPHIAQLRDQRVLVRLHILHQFCRNRSSVGAVRRRRAVPRIAQHPHFVLHLDHQHRMLRSIHLADVLHQRAEGLCVGVACLVAEGAQQLQRPGQGNGLAIIDLNPREPLIVLLHPVRRKA